MARSEPDTGAPLERDPGILTDEDLAAQVDVDVETIRLLAAAGVLPGQQAGGRWVFSGAAVAACIGGPGIDVRDFLTAEQLAAPDRLDMHVKTVRSLAAAGVLPGIQAGRRWLFRWSVIYTLIAGPGVPPGKVLSPRQLARELGVPLRVIHNALERGELPGRHVGKQWRSALEAVRQRIAGAAGGQDESRPASVPGAAQRGPTPG